MSLIFELSPVDRHFASFICRQTGEPSELLELLASLVSNAVGNNNICLDLTDVAGKAVRVDGRELTVPPLAEVRSRLAGEGAVGAPGHYRPLVLDPASRLYLHRYWSYERDLVEFILERSNRCTDIDEATARDGVGRLFPDGTDDCDWQKVAAVTALFRRFCVISGGPGTGKTSTVIKILALLLEQPEGEGLRMALAAPTGKAATRLKDSIRGMKEKLACAGAVKDRIPEEVATIHRLLGSTGDGRFRFAKENPLPYDVVIIDEASMVALPIMARLAVALKKDARLILLGDKDQLASVEAGAVLGDICGGEGRELYSPAFSELVASMAGERVIPVATAGALPPLVDSVVILKKNHRFRIDSGIGALGAAVNTGDGVRTTALLRAGGASGVAGREVPPPEMLKQNLAGAVVEGFSAYLKAGSPEEALTALDSFRILCAIRQGPYGVNAVNCLVEEILAAQRLINPGSRWYQGRPVMVTVNDYNLKLFNGDVGICFADPKRAGSLRAYFPAPGGGVRSFSPARLPEHETVYAMTIHKSQGSEFERLLLMLPANDSEILSRELLYTGITRARSGVELWGNEEVIFASLSRKTRRKSGLRDALWPDEDQPATTSREPW